MAANALMLNQDVYDRHGLQFRWHDWHHTDYNWDTEEHSPRSGNAMLTSRNNPNKINALVIAIVTTRSFANPTRQWQFRWYGYARTEDVKDLLQESTADFSMMWPIVPQWNLLLTV